jgi:hypothetical protein
VQGGLHLPREAVTGDAARLGFAVNADTVFDATCPRTSPVSTDVPRPSLDAGEVQVAEIAEAYSSWGWIGPSRILFTESRVLVLPTGPGSSVRSEAAYRKWRQSLGLRHLPNVHRAPARLGGVSALLDLPHKRITKAWAKPMSGLAQDPDTARLFLRAPLSSIRETPATTVMVSIVGAMGSLPFLGRMPNDFRFFVPWSPATVLDFLRKTPLAAVVSK